MKIISASSPEQSRDKAKEILYQIVDAKTVLFLSGGSTPRLLYEALAHEEHIHPAAAGMIDERAGLKWHERSNELMIKQTGLLRYFEMIDVSWNGIISGSVIPSDLPAGRQEAEESPSGKHLSDRDPSTSLRFAQDDNLNITAQKYDAKVRELLFHFPKSVAILGIGGDGHTAGIPAKSTVILGSRQLAATPESIWSWRDSGQARMTDCNLVSSYNDTSGKYGQRITMTFTALSLIDHLIILAFGGDKKDALQRMFTKGSLEEVPARFYHQPEISKKTVLITDQEV